MTFGVAGSVSLRRAARGPAGRCDRDRESDTDEKPLVGWIGQCRYDADHLSASIQQRATGAARVHGRVELDQSVEIRPPLVRD